MAKLVILKSFLDAYYDDLIEKSTTHKYIRRVPKSNGKGYNYFYPEDFKKPMKALAILKYTVYQMVFILPIQTYLQQTQLQDTLI